MKKVIGATFILLILMIIPISVGYFIFNQTNINQSNSTFTEREKKLIMGEAPNTPMKVLTVLDKKDSLNLRKKSNEVEFFEKETLSYLKNRLISTVLSPNYQGIGIASPQVGILKRIILVKRFDKPEQEFEMYINPVIISHSDTLVLRKDGCLSMPDVSGMTQRYIWITVAYQDIDGTHLEEKITDELTAHIFQHEIDHLDGILITDRMGLMPKTNR